MKKLFFFYTIVICCISLFSYLFIDANLLYLKAVVTGFSFKYREIATVVYVGLLLVLFVLYFFIVQAFNEVQNKMLWFKRYIAASVIILLFSYPAMLSYDIFNYIFTAKVLFYYRENPYIIMPIAFLGDPLLYFTHAANKSALYGPFWIILSGIPYVLGFGNFLLILLQFKLFISGFYIATLWILWKLTKDIKTLILFAFNPLILIETLVSAHNDIVMVFFMLVTLWLLKNKYYLLTLGSFIASGFVKYASLVLFPLILFLYWKTIKKVPVVWQQWYYYISLILLVFMLIAASIREEIYPWYAIWFFSFACMVPERKTFILFSQIICISLMLRYVPFMFLGTHFGPTPSIKIFITIVPALLFLFYVSISKYKWLKK